MLSKRAIGNMGEKAAVKYLKKNGYNIIECNFYSKFGEIDIIAKDKEYYVFIEVKTRKSDLFGGGEAAVNIAKQNRIRKTAEIYLQEKNLNTAVRFDVALVYEKETGFEIGVIKNAF